MDWQIRNSKVIIGPNLWHFRWYKSVVSNHHKIQKEGLQWQQKPSLAPPNLIQIVLHLGTSAFQMPRWELSIMLLMNPESLTFWWQYVTQQCTTFPSLSVHLLGKNKKARIGLISPGAIKISTSNETWLGGQGPFRNKNKTDLRLRKPLLQSSSDLFHS